MAKKFNEYLPYIAVIAIVGIVALTVAFLNGTGGIEGAPVYEENVGGYELPCLDDDSANDYYVAGKVKMGSIEYYDHCRGDTLYQYHCATSMKVDFNRPYDCSNGCLNGACIR